jgi:LCP family protein required for cell wall assembly
VSPDIPPSLAAGMLKRAALAAVLIVLLTAGAVSAAGFLTADDLINTIEKEGRPALDIPDHEIDRAAAGEPQTIMLLGSDERYDDKKTGNKPLSDTILLVRLDPDKQAIAVTSIPRDLQVEIPGIAGRNKINYAFKRGGVSLTLKTVKKVLSTPERPFRVNHVVTLGFGDFRRAVNYIGCVYADIDRDYFNDNTGGGENYATIDLDPGYQKVCGQDALDYVRYRHGDTDLVRAARQQDFLRQIKQSREVRELLQWRSRHKVALMAGRYLETSKGLRRKKDLFRILQLMIYTAGKPIQEVQFRSRLSADNVNVESSQRQIDKTMDEFFQVRASAKPRRTPKPTASDRAGLKTRKKRRPARVAGLEVAKREGEDQALLAAKRARMPFYFPTLRKARSAYAGKAPRIYGIRDESGKIQRAYRMVIHTGILGEYYGIQGTTWRDPPILDDPSETRIDPRTGRRLELFYDGRRLRLVAWRTKKDAYWVSNTLTQSLSESQMLAIAGSMRRLGR